MNGSFLSDHPLARQFADWIASLDSRPREKQLAIATGIVAALCAWFGIALGSLVLLLALPLLAGALYGGVRLHRRLEPVERPIDVTLDRVVAAPRPKPQPAPVAPVEDEDDEPSDNLLSRISLAPPPPPVGRSSASYVYQPASDPQPPDAHDEEDDLPDDEPAEVGDRYYEVCETVAGRSLVRHSSPSLFGATDYALELHGRSRGSEIEVVRVRGDARERVLRFSNDAPPEGSETAKSLLDLFGYPVTRWSGPQRG